MFWERSSSSTEVAWSYSLKTFSGIALSIGFFWGAVLRASNQQVASDRHDELVRMIDALPKPGPPPDSGGESPHATQATVSASEAPTDPTAALFLLFRDLEIVLRDAEARTRGQEERLPNRMMGMRVLVESLRSRGLLTPAHFNGFRKLSEIRNSLFHGRIPPLDGEHIDKLAQSIAAANDIIRSIPAKKHG